VSAGGLLIYSAIFALSFLMRKYASRNQWLALLFLSALASASALWFISLQIFELRSYCFYCLTIHACGLWIAFTVFKTFPWQDIGTRSAITSILAGVAGVAVLAAGQLYAGKSADNQTVPLTEPGVNKPQISKESPVVENRDVVLANGKLRFSPSDFPFFGSGNTPNFVAHFFDFTCPACRRFHSTLMSTYQTYENQTTLIMVPVPLDSECNPSIKETAYIHQNACAFAKIGLAIWRSSPQAYKSYDEFLFREPYPPSLEAARDFADHLVGKDAMDRSLVDPEMMAVLQKGLQMFYSQAFEQKSIPALVTGNQVFTGFPPPGLLTQIFMSP
jgi:protein-disulfide isomerase